MTTHLRYLSGISWLGTLPEGVQVLPAVPSFSDLSAAVKALAEARGEDEASSRDAVLAVLGEMLDLPPEEVEEALHRPELLSAPHPPALACVLTLVGICLEQLRNRAALVEECRVAWERAEFLSGATFEGTAVHDGSRVIDVNLTLARMLGYTRAELVGVAVPGPFVPEGEAEKVKNHIAQGFQGPYETVFIRRDGSSFPVEIQARNLVLNGVPVRVVGARDITAWKEAQTLLRESEERFRALVESTYDGVIVSRMGMILEANEAWASMFGYTPEEAIGLLPTDVCPQESADLIYRHIQEGYAGAYEITGVRKDGSRFPLEILGRNCTYKGHQVRITGFRDLTQKKLQEAEEARLEERIQQAQRLESLGILAGGIAHDFNNLLVGVLGNTEMAEAQLENPAAVKPLLRRVKTAATRASELTQQMLAYAGQSRLSVQRIDLNTLVVEMVHLLEVSLSKKTALRYQFASSLPAVEGDGSQLRQVVMNLITNAKDAMDGGRGSIHLSTGVALFDQEWLRHTLPNPDLPEGEYVYLEVKDEGVGMDEATVSRMFEPFFTTRFTGRGMGLSAVLGIVRTHGGTLRVESVPGRGTTMTVLLPPVSGRADPSQPPKVGTLGWKGRGSVLVVDDEATVREVTAEALRRSGFIVRTAVDGQEGIECYAQIFAQQSDDIVLVVMDLTMPRLGGEEAFAILRSLNPSLPVLFTSGYHEPDALADALQEAGTAFLQKPYGASQLLNEVRHLLEDGSS